ncbi:MAG: glycoside hydrolase family 130 protein [Spirochaetia bacterium]|jgi:beta-1,4-mannooligosaccharide/beta-1,4-mannosyl-N-acetylglucosamine phosphorylase
MSLKIIGEKLSALPWQDRPSQCTSPLWRYSENPIVGRHATPQSNSIFNSAVVPFKQGFAGVFRVDDTARRMNINRGMSSDGIHWQIDPEPIRFVSTVSNLPDSEYKYDPRVVWLDKHYYLFWCNGYHGPGIGAGYTDDFQTFHRQENIFAPYNRNGVPFPRKINGNFAILHRPSDNGHTQFGDIFYSESPDMTYWGKHRWVMGTRGSDSAWQSTKVGAGAVPIETSEGWLLIYHGVLTSCNGFVYSMGAALLDLEQPWKLRARGRNYLLSPQTPYECVGDVPNVAFPCASLQDPGTGRIVIYYGGADTCVNIAFGMIEEIIDFVKSDSIGP